MKLSSDQDFYKKRLKGLWVLLRQFWLILIIFTIVSVITGQADFMPGNALKFILNALLLENSYNGAWWYLFTYVILVLISPLIIKAAKKFNPLIVLGIGFIVYSIAYYVRFEIAYSNWLLGKFGPFGMTFFEYLLGIECCKYQVFTKMHKIWDKIKLPFRWVIAIVALAVMLCVRTQVVASLFVAPITGFAIMTLFHFWKKPVFIEKAFLYVGKHSTNIWLTHMFFYSVLFKNLVYIAKYPLLIFIFMMAITLILSKLLQLIDRGISYLFKRIKIKKEVA